MRYLKDIGQELSENNNENQEQFIDISELTEQLQQVNINPIELPIDNLQEVIEYDKNEFEKGIRSMSFLAGELTALLNTGITKEDAVTILVNKDNIEHAQKLQQMINENNIKVVEKQAEKVQNQEL